MLWPGSVRESPRAVEGAGGGNFGEHEQFVMFTQFRSSVMSQPRSLETRILTTDEREAVDQSRTPALDAMDRPALVALARGLRQARDKARDVSRQRRRTHRGKDEPRGAGAAPDPEGLDRKTEVFTSALKRVNRRLERQSKAAPDQGSLSRKALAMRRASEKRHHPASGRTAHHGLQPVSSTAVEPTIDPLRIGSVSQATRNNQARRDG
jgi:hypothetical protein